MTHGSDDVGAQQAEDQPTGPRGGTTTVTKSGMVKKNLWIQAEHGELLRRKAFDERRSEADIIREALCSVLGVKYVSEATGGSGSE